MKTVMDRIWGVGGKLATVLGIVAGALVELAPYVDLLPKDSRIHYIAAGLVAFGLWYRGMPPKAPAVTPIVLVLSGLLFAAPTFAQDATPPGILPSAGTCFSGGDACIAPVLTVVPLVIDARSGKVANSVAFGVGYGLTFTHLLSDGWRPGVDFLGGTKTSGGWMAAVMPKIGVLRLGPVVSHDGGNGATYLGIGAGSGTP